MTKFYEQAFPVAPEMWAEGQFKHPTIGMTKREYFAAKALQGMLANSHEEAWGMNPDQVAAASVQFADYLIKKLNELETMS